MLSEDWLLVLGRDGVVEGVDGGAPPAWIGRRFEDCSAMPEPVRVKARKLTREPLGRACVRRERVEAVEPGAPSFTLIGLEAILLRPAPLAIGPLVRRALAPLVEQAAVEGVSLQLELAEVDGVEVSLDADKIAWALSTLVGNALRYVRRADGALPGSRVRVSAALSVSRKMVGITVADDGPGIAAELRPWLLEPNPATGRTVGVGLRLVHDIAGAHGGGMVLKSSAEPLERGTTVTLWLPLEA